MNGPIEQYLATLRLELIRATDYSLFRQMYPATTPHTPEIGQYIDKALGEVTTHLREQADQLISQGVEPTEAERRAAAAFGPAKPMAFALAEKSKRVVSTAEHLIGEGYWLGFALITFPFVVDRTDEFAEWSRWSNLWFQLGLYCAFVGAILLFTHTSFKLQVRWLVTGGLVRTAIATTAFIAAVVARSRIPDFNDPSQKNFLLFTGLMVAYWFGVLVYSQAQRKRMKLAEMVR